MFDTPDCQSASKRSVTVIDSIMGSGKTSYLIEKLNALAMAERISGKGEPRKFIVITPSLTEVDRITAACSLLNFMNPVPIHGRKYWGLKTLLENGQNVCCTHQLFRRMGRDIQAELRKQGYHLIIDEAIDTVEIYTGLTAQDFGILLDTGSITVEPDSGLLQWTGPDDYSGKFDQVKELILNGSLVARGGNLIIWEFPLSFLDCFVSTTILTYLFHGSTLSSYLEAGGVEIKMKAIHNDALVDWAEVNEREIKERLRGLLCVYQGRSNAIGNSKPGEKPLSASWYNRAHRGKTGGIATLRGNIESFFKSNVTTSSKENMWTTFKEHQSRLAGKGYTKGFLPNTLRATNEYRHKESAAYCCNLFMNTVIKSYLQSRNVVVHEELFSLSEMIQWLWRGCIREHRPMTLFIPSERMRTLFMTWLDSDSTAELMGKLGVNSDQRSAAYSDHMEAT